MRLANKSLSHGAHAISNAAWLERQE